MLMVKMSPMVIVYFVSLVPGRYRQFQPGGRLKVAFLPVHFQGFLRKVQSYGLIGRCHAGVVNNMSAL